jgi:MFS family permease
MPEEGASANSQDVQPSTPYTVFTKREKWYLTYLLGYLTLASSLTATIYFPLIDLLAQQYTVSVQDINLTITLYVLFQGIAPSFWAPLSDTLGRRPVFLATFTVYTLASLGLTFTDHSYVALLLLRACQSAGGSAVISLAYAVVADVSVHAERGSILGPMLAATNLGPCVGPVIGGGAILASGDPRWCFRALLIFGGSALILIGGTMSETGRMVVGNGAVPAKSIWRTWRSVLAEKVRSATGLKQTKGEKEHLKEEGTSAVISSEPNVNSGKTGKGRLTFPNPLASLRLIFFWDTSLILWLVAAPYALWYCVQTSIPLIFGIEYGFNDLFVGLCYISGGSGVIAGGFIAGRLMDWNYKKTAQEAGIPVSRASGDNIDQFPIEEARSKRFVTIIAVSMCVVIGYGWVVQFHVHPTVPLILQFCIGCKATVLLQIYSALLVDIFPDTPGTAAASNNIARCALSATAVAVLQPSVDAIGRAWVFTLLGLIDGVGCIIAVLVLRRWGRTWRSKRAPRQ